MKTDAVVKTMRTGTERAFPLLFAIFHFIESKELIWRFDADISNPKNWVGGGPGRDCKGTNFAAVNAAPILLKQLTTAELTLPRDGEILLDPNGYIHFEDNKKCINLKPIDYHDWYDPSSWIQPTDNTAVPDKERIPCNDDHVTFPKIEHTRIAKNIIGSISVGSITTDKDKNSPKLENSLSQHHADRDTFTIEASPKICLDPYGCLCHDQPIFCPMRETDEKVNCLYPVFPENSCHEICGAYLTYKVGKGPKLKEIQEKLKGVEVDAYASRVKNYLGSEVVQIVFSEKEYSGRSLDEADKLFEYLKKTPVENLEIYKSGRFQMEGGGSSMGIIFGSLAAVLVFFGVIFYLNADGPVGFFDRFRARGSVFSMPFFARFDNTDENLIIDGQSESGSILNIAKSFDNPMYGQSSTTCDVAEMAKDSDVEE